jgi:hypothetical protein
MYACTHFREDGKWLLVTAVICAAGRFNEIISARNWSFHFFI